MPRKACNSLSVLISGKFFIAAVFSGSTRRPFRPKTTPNNLTSSVKSFAFDNWILRLNWCNLRNTVTRFRVISSGVSAPIKMSSI